MTALGRGLSFEDNVVRAGFPSSVVGVKGGRGSRMRSAAAGEHRTGEHPAQRTLEADVAAKLCGGAVV